MAEKVNELHSMNIHFRFFLITEKLLQLSIEQKDFQFTPPIHTSLNSIIMATKSENNYNKERV